MKDLDLSTVEELGKMKLAGLSAVVVLPVVLAGAGFVYSQIDIDSQRNTFNTNATVINPNTTNGTVEAGLAVGEGMSFGRFDARFNKTKSLVLTSDNLTYVTVSTEGNISDMLYYTDEYLFTGRQKISFEIAADSYGYYEGKINLKIETAKSRWAEKWLRLKHRYF